MSVSASVAPRGVPITAPRQARVGRAVAGCVVAVCAYGGALGLMTGLLDLGADLNQRLPFHSPVFGGLALAAIVGVPFTTVAADAWRGSPRTDRSTFYAGYVLVGWILVELGFIREFSFLHPLFLAVGVACMVAGSRGRLTT